ncbi:MAG: tetratricopeptide repeat protein, partial [Proteobacteria bacterium]|nr:tetratricopeptide repeat protein [Pseudomonadota bacterium]
DSPAQNSPDNAQRQARATPPRTPDRHAREQIVHQDMLTQMAFWAGEYDSFPNDLEAAQRFAETLRKAGRADRAVAVAEEALQRFPDDKPLTLTYGLAQIAARHPQQALRPLAVVAAGDTHDWRVRSALGVALDQLGRFTEARQAYQEALAIQPNDAGVLTNLGVSHLMEGDPAGAEPFLRRAMAQPNAPAESRQNLAIAVALQGRFDEAQALERIDLPPAQAAANIEYLRGLLSDPHRWGDVGRQNAGR